MKSKLSTAILLNFILLSNLTAQFSFVDRLYTKMVFEELAVIDTTGKVLAEEELFQLLYQVDTLTSCFGEAREEFVENLYSSNGLAIVTTVQEINTINSKDEQEQTDFVRTYRDDTGELLGSKKIFSLDARVASKLYDTIHFDFTKNDERLLNEENEDWVVWEIQIGKRNVFIDDCHKMYKLHFESKKKYSQTYNGAKECETIVDKALTKPKAYLSYWEKEVLHRINFQEGKWKTKKGKLYLTNKTENRNKIIPYSVEKDLLILEASPDYLIKLKKKVRR